MAGEIIEPRGTIVAGLRAGVPVCFDVKQTVEHYWQVTFVSID